MLDCQICTSHADGPTDILETRDQPLFYACKGEVTWNFYEEPGFIIRTFLASSGKPARSVTFLVLVLLGLVNSGKLLGPHGGLWTGPSGAVWCAKPFQGRVAYGIDSRRSWGS